MAQKWNLQDIRPPKRTELREESLAGAGQQQRSDVRPRRRQEETERGESNTFSERIDIIDGRRRNIKRWIVSAVVVILIFGLGFGISMLLRGAEVTVYPKAKDVTVQATFTAKQEAAAAELPYELLVLEEVGERQVEASGEEEVSERASGIITIYNEYSAATERLVKNTRFESPDGFIYRIQDSIEVPGYTKGSDNLILPGEVTVEVFADGTGESYNIGPSRFTIPGFEDTDRFDAMYAESNLPMSGGFEGLKFIINEEELATAKQELHMELRNKLLERFPEERPAGFVTFDGAVTFVYDSLPSTQSGEKLATIKERARLMVPLFPEDTFAEYIAQNTIAGYEPAPVRLQNKEGLVFSYPEDEPLEDISLLDELIFTLAGQATVVWEYDSEKLQNDLLGITKTGLPTVLSGYPAIERAEAIVRPFWSRAFPDDPTKITIIEVIEK